MAISWLAYKNNIKQRNDSLYEQRKIFYDKARDIVLSKLKYEFSKTATVENLTSVKIGNLRRRAIFPYQTPEPTIAELKTEAGHLFSEQVMRFFDLLSDNEITKRQYWELQQDQYADWFYYSFKEYLEFK